MRPIRLAVACAFLLLCAGVAGASDDVTSERRDGNIVTSGGRTTGDADCSRYAATGSRTCTEGTAAAAMMPSARPRVPSVQPVARRSPLIAFMFRMMQR